MNGFVRVCWLHTFFLRGCCVLSFSVLWVPGVWMWYASKSWISIDHRAQHLTVKHQRQVARRMRIKCRLFLEKESKLFGFKSTMILIKSECSFRSHWGQNVANTLKTSVQSLSIGRFNHFWPIMWITRKSMLCLACWETATDFWWKEPYTLSRISAVMKLTTKV